MTDPELSWALEQLESVEEASAGTVKITNVVKSPFESYPLQVELSIGTKHLPHDASGVRLRDRERILLFVPDDFPFRVPKVEVPHVRFGGLPHVQWGSGICLYQSPSTEWNPADGLFGLLERIEEWLSKASTGELADRAGPLHPPVAYVSPRLGAKSVVIEADTPPVGDEPWLGIARIKEINDRRVDVCGWVTNSNSIGLDEIAGAAIFLTGVMPFEYPQSFQELVSCLKPCGLSTKSLLQSLAKAAEINNPIYPLYVILGTPMRRMPDVEEYSQHLAVWYLDPGTVDSLRKVGKFLDAEENEKVDDFIRSLETGSRAPIEWCKVLEARPEVTIRRDEQTSVSWFRDKSVAILGVGALGAQICEFLIRAGVRKLVIYDRGVVSPGILVRQPYANPDIGKLKVEALKSRLRHIRKVDIEMHSADVLMRPLGLSDWADGVDVVIDATANTSVLAKLELVRREGLRKVPTVSVVIGPTAERGLVLVSGPEHSGGVLDVSRKAKIAVCGIPAMADFMNDFWNTKAQHQPFQPEPGCSESTFVGSATDVVSLAGMMLNCASRDLSSMQPSQATARMLSQPWLLTADNFGGHFTWESDLSISAESSGYEVRIQPEAVEEIENCIAANDNNNGAVDETGGVLFGEINEACRIVWVTEVSGPPPDSSSSPAEFICGIEGVQESNEQKREQTGTSVHFLGMWHTHPNSIAQPSSIDLNSVLGLLHEEKSRLSKALMLIAAGSNGNVQLGCGVFRRNSATAKWMIYK